MSAYELKLILIFAAILSYSSCKAKDLIIARLITLDDSYQFAYKSRFKFTNVLSTHKTR